MTQSLFWMMTGIGVCLTGASIFLRRTVYAIACQTVLGILFSLMLVYNGQTYAAFVVFALSTVLFGFLSLFSLKAGEGETEALSLSSKARYFIIALIAAAFAGTAAVLSFGGFFFKSGKARIRPVQLTDVGKELFENNSHVLLLIGILLIIGCIGVSVLLSSLNEQDALQETNKGAKDVGQ